MSEQFCSASVQERSIELQTGLFEGLKAHSGEFALPEARSYLPPVFLKTTKTAAETETMRSAHSLAEHHVCLREGSRPPADVAVAVPWQFRGRQLQTLDRPSEVRAPTVLTAILFNLEGLCSIAQRR